MSDHLPECFSLMCECEVMHFEDTDCHFSCICPSLRACEQRVRESAATLWDRTKEEISYARIQGFRDGVNAAKDAVLTEYLKDSVAVRSQTEWGIQVAINAIYGVSNEQV